MQRARRLVAGIALLALLFPLAAAGSVIPDHVGVRAFSHGVCVYPKDPNPISLRDCASGTRFCFTGHVCVIYARGFVVPPEPVLGLP